MASDKSRKRVAKKYGDMPDKWDDWHVRLPDPKEQLRVIELYHRSGSKSKSEFVRARLLGEHFKVITVDKSAVEYHRKLSELTAQVHSRPSKRRHRIFHIALREELVLKI